MSDKTIHLDERLYEYFRRTAYREHEVLRALRERTRDVWPSFYSDKDW